jgi:hypothetical protein
MSDLEQLIASMTVSDLAKLSGKTASEIAAFALSGSVPRATSTAPSTRATEKPRPPRPNTNTNTTSVRTIAGRADLDARILAAVQAAGGPVSSAELEAQVGGNAMQRRAALKRLVESRKIQRQGVARATTYAAR